MKFKQITIPAHTDYALTRVKGKRRDEWYGARVYSTRDEAQKEADRMNGRRDPSKHGSIEVQEYRREESIVLHGFMPL